jgi:ArsR family transcriptional regulator
LLQALRPGERRVMDLVEETGLSQPNVSKHLRCLRGCGLVEADKRGRETFYAISPTAGGVLDVLDAAAEQLAPRMAACRLTAETLGCRP